MLKRDKVEIDPELRKLTEGNRTEWREPGTRNFIRVGDVVKVAPSAPRKRDGFEGRVMAIHDEGWQVVFQLLGGPHGRLHTRFIRSERISRVAMVRTNSETGVADRRERKR